MRIQGNSYFYRGIVRIVLSLPIVGAGVFLYPVIQPPEMQSVFLFAMILVGVLPFARGVYYLIPFKYGSAWNGELRWKWTAGEALVTVVVIALCFYTKTPFTLDYISVAVFLVLMGVIYVVGKLDAKRPHAPVRKTWFDTFLESRGMY